MIGLFDGDLCVTSDHKLCAEVHVNAERFAINSKFSCKIVVSRAIGRILLGHQIGLQYLILVVSI